MYLSMCSAVLQLMLASQPWKTSKEETDFLKLLWIFSLNRDRIKTVEVRFNENPPAKVMSIAVLVTFFQVGVA